MTHHNLIWWLATNFPRCNPDFHNGCWYLDAADSRLTSGYIDSGGGRIDRYHY